MCGDLSIGPEVQVDFPDDREVRPFALNQLTGRLIAGDMSRDDDLEISLPHAGPYVLRPNRWRVSGKPRSEA